LVIYYAGVDSNPKDIADAFGAGARHFMLSFFYAHKHTSSIRLLRQLGAHIMLDSGAYSAWKKSSTVCLADYIAYIKRNQIGKYVALDVVGDPEATAHNTIAMESAGLFPIPVFHIDADWRILDGLVSRYRYIALGGTVGRSRSIREVFFDEVFSRHPTSLFHGLGMTIPELMRKYPWASVDSTTWQTGKRNAKVVTDSGQVPIDGSLPVSQRIKLNVHYFGRLESEINLERCGEAA